MVARAPAALLRGLTPGGAPAARRAACCANPPSSVATSRSSPFMTPEGARGADRRPGTQRGLRGRAAGITPSRVGSTARGVRRARKLGAERERAQTGYSGLAAGKQTRPRSATDPASARFRCRTLAPSGSCRLSRRTASAGSRCCATLVRLWSHRWRRVRRRERRTPSACLCSVLLSSTARPRPARTPAVVRSSGARAPPRREPRGPELAACRAHHLR
jgi:hypothetical protein